MKSDLDRIQDRNAFENEVTDFLFEVLAEKDRHPAESLLAIHPQSRELRVGVSGEFSSDWNCYELDSFFQNEDGLTEPDCDAIADFAASYVFVR